MFRDSELTSMILERVEPLEEEIDVLNDFIDYLIVHCIQKDYPTASRESLYATFEYHKQSLK